MSTTSSPTGSSCQISRQTGRLIDQHFARRGSQRSERRMRAHLAQCAECRAAYDRYLLLAELDPSVPGAKQRIAQGLGLQTRRPSILQRPQTWAVAVAAGCLLALLLTTTQTSRGVDGFQARGATSAVEPELLVYRLGPSGVPTLVEGAVAPTDELAFAYRNPAGRKRLMVFGLDRSGRVYWYHPAWHSPDSNPPAVPIRAAPGLHELREAIRHPLRGDTLEIVALFTDAPLRAKRVEQQLGRGGKLDALAELPNTSVNRQTLRLR